MKEKGALYAAYISSFANGGIFIATDREFRLGDDVYLLLSLPDDAVKHPIAGKVGWVNPAGAGHRSQGIGWFSRKTENARSSKPASKMSWAPGWALTAPPKPFNFFFCLLRQLRKGLFLLHVYRFALSFEFS